MPRNSIEGVATEDQATADERTITMAEVGQASIKAYNQVIESVYKRAEEKNPDAFRRKLEFTQVEVDQIKEIIPSLFYAMEEPGDIFKYQAILGTLSKFKNAYGSNEFTDQVEQAFQQELIEHLPFIEMGIEHCPGAWEKMRYIDLVNTCAHSAVRENRATAVDWLANHTQTICDIYFEDPANDYFFTNVIDTVVNKTGGEQLHQFKETISTQMAEKMNSENCGVLSELFIKEGYSTEKFSRELAMMIAQKRLGLPPSVFDAWKESAGTDEADEQDKKISFNRNIIGAFELEEAMPGCPAELYKRYGIANFGRYPKEILLRQYEKRDDNSTPYGVATMPYSDHNTAFMHDFEQFSTLFNNFAAHGKDPDHPDKELRIVEGGQKYSIMRKLVEMRRINGPIEYAIIGGHGSPFSVGYGPGVGPEYKLLSSEIYAYVKEEKKYSETPRPQAMKAVESLFVENPTVVLVSCSTGKGEENIAKQLSSLGMIVTAPDQDTSLEAFYVGRKGKKLILLGIYHGANARTWFNGKELTKDEVKELYDKASLEKEE